MGLNCINSHLDYIRNEIWNLNSQENKALRILEKISPDLWRCHISPTEADFEEKFLKAKAFSLIVARAFDGYRPYQGLDDDCKPYDGVSVHVERQLAEAEELKNHSDAMYDTQLGKVADALSGVEINLSYIRDEMLSLKSHKNRSFKMLEQIVPELWDMYQYKTADRFHTMLANAIKFSRFVAKSANDFNPWLTGDDSDVIHNREALRSHLSSALAKIHAARAPYKEVDFYPETF